MPKPLVFISHSAKDALAREVLDKLTAKLELAFEVLLDQHRLEASDDWRRELNTWMGLCHGAIILFSSDALESAWVLQEATILRWRRELDQSFVLIPVLIPPVNHNSLDQSERFAPLALNEIQMLSTDTADAVIERILKRLEDLSQAGDKESPLRSLEREVAARLSELETTTADAIRIAASKLGATLAWRSDLKYSDQFARALLNADFSQISEAVLMVAKYFNDANTAIRIIDRLFPLWVDPRAVTRLPEMIHQPQKQRAVCINGIKENTAKSYVKRAQLGFGHDDIYPWILATVTSPNGYEEQPDLQAEIATKEIATRVLDYLGFSEDDDLFDGKPDAQLAAKEKSEPLFIIVPKGLNESVLELLRERFYRFTFFLLRDEAGLDPAGFELKHIELLEPKLAPAAEDDVYVTYKKFKGAVKQLQEGWD